MPRRITLAVTASCRRRRRRWWCRGSDGETKATPLLRWARGGGSTLGRGRKRERTTYTLLLPTTTRVYTRIRVRATGMQHWCVRLLVIAHSGRTDGWEKNVKIRGHGVCRARRVGTRARNVFEGTVVARVLHGRRLRENNGEKTWGGKKKRYGRTAWAREPVVVATPLRLLTDRVCARAVCRVRATGLRGARRIFASRNDRGGARALHAGGCSRVRAAVQSGAYKSAGWAWPRATAVLSRVRARRRCCCGVSGGDSVRISYTADTHAQTGRVCARARGNRDTTPVSFCTLLSYACPCEVQRKRSHFRPSFVKRRRHHRRSLLQPPPIVFFFHPPPVITR